MSAFFQRKTVTTYSIWNEGGCGYVSTRVLGNLLSSKVYLLSVDFVYFINWWFYWCYFFDLKTCCTFIYLFDTQLMHYSFYNVQTIKKYVEEEQRSPFPRGKCCPNSGVYCSRLVSTYFHIYKRTYTQPVFRRRFNLHTVSCTNSKCTAWWVFI